MWRSFVGLTVFGLICNVLGQFGNGGTCQEGEPVNPDSFNGCHFFDRCVNGQPQETLCAGNSYFDSSTFNCTLTIQDNPQCSAPRFDDGDCSPGVTPVDCSTYSICNGGKTSYFECPVGTLFNPISNVCDWEWSPELSDDCRVEMSPQ